MPKTQSNPQDAAFQALLQAHNYTPAAKSAPASTGGWYDKLTASTPEIPTAPSYSDQVRAQAESGAKEFASSIDSLRTAPEGRPEDVRAALKGGGPLKAGAEVVAQGAEMGVEGVAKLGHAVGALGSVALSPLAPVFNKATEVGEALGNEVPDSIAKPYADVLNKNPVIEKAAKTGMDLLNLAMPEAAKGGAAALDTGMSAVKKAMEVPPEKVAAAQASAKAQVAADVKAQSVAQSKKIATEWEAPSKIGMASYNKSRAALEQSPDTPKFLGDLGLNPAAHIEDGKYSPDAMDNSAQSLRDTAGKMSKETLRPSLQMADYTTPRTPVADVIKQAIESAKKDKGATAGDAEAIAAKLEKEQAALEKKYPDGMSLTDMHDEKITYAKNGGYSPIKSAADNNAATANRHVGSSLGDTVAAKAPKDVPVDAFNKYLSNFYKAADYLDTLQNKKAPVSMGQAIARNISKFAGAAVGAHLGGGVVSAFAGYSIGKALEHAMENLTGKAQSTFVDNIKRTNPEAYKQVEQYLKDQTSGNTGIPRLNPPSAIQLPEGPNVLTKPTPNGESGVQIIPAEKNPVSVDPKTNRFQTSYRSSPKESQSPSNLSPNQTTPMTSNMNANIPESIPQAAQKAIADHLTSAEQVVNQNPKTDIPALLEQTKTNIADGLEAQGFKAIADHVRAFTATAYQSVKDFTAALLDHMKSLNFNDQRGFVKIKGDAAPSVEKVAKNIGGSDVAHVQDFVEKPTLENWMRLQPLLASDKGFMKMGLADLQDFFKEVFIVRNNPDFNATPSFKQNLDTGKMSGKE